MTRTPLDSFEAKYREAGDPWDYATSPYELAKYARTVAALDGRHFGRGLELAASIGVLTERLQPSCDVLVALEPARTAAAQLRERVPGVEVVEAALPEGLPDGPFDLIVASECLYYLSPDLLAQTLDGLEARLPAGATLLAVHWTGRSADHVLTGEAVHEALHARPALEHELGDTQPGYVLDRFHRRPVPVARRRRRHRG